MTTKTWEESDVLCYSQYDDSELGIIHPELLRLMGEVQMKRIVDYGCGEGKFLEELVERGAEVYGYDISEAMIVEARKKIDGRGELKVIESGKIPLAECSIDAVVSNLVLMMCPSKQTIEQIFRDVHRVVVPQGKWTFCITHPAFSDYDFTTFRNIFSEGMDYFQEGQPYQFVLKRRDGTQITTNSFVDHHYPLATYLNLLSETGFRLERVEEVFVQGNKFPPYLIAKSSVVK